MIFGKAFLVFPLCEMGADGCAQANHNSTQQAWTAVPDQALPVAFCKEHFH